MTIHCKCYESLTSAWKLWIPGKRQQGGGVKLTRKASETRLAAPGEEVASPLVLVSGFALAAPGEEVTSLTIACIIELEVKFDSLQAAALENIKTLQCHDFFPSLRDVIEFEIHSCGIVILDPKHHFARSCTSRFTSANSSVYDSRPRFNRPFIPYLSFHSIYAYGSHCGGCAATKSRCLSWERKSLMLTGSEFQSLGRAIVKEDEYEEVRWDGIVSIDERVFSDYGGKKVALYGCETWTVTLREEQRLRVFENKVLRKIFGAKRDEVTGEWRKLHNAELNALYSSPDIIRNIKCRPLRWAGHVARMGESRNAYRVLVGRLEGKRPLGRPIRRWQDNIKMDLREVGYDGRDWINLARDRDRWLAYTYIHTGTRINRYKHTVPERAGISAELQRELLTRNLLYVQSEERMIDVHLTCIQSMKDDDEN
ncbi:hypothetical protein ANN_01684 [Periplaneta americana]|uniref:Uncharacterized protein n=1 Tax=Periplaneta americana TaxID=6978 RepID=A0ABQ8TU89_PERAM|nr:hypothetical protein ANN_01684 [Periplaneta americana]